METTNNRPPTATQVKALLHCVANRHDGIAVGEGFRAPTLWGLADRGLLVAVIAADNNGDRAFVGYRVTDEGHALAAEAK